MRVRKRVVSFSRNSLPALVGGFGLALSIPPWGFWILAFPGAALLWWRLGGGLNPDEPPRLRSRLWLGWVAGIGLYGPGLFWATSFNLYGGIIMILIESLALGLACAACGTGRGRLLALPGAMILAEWLREIWPFGGLPLGGVALGQVAGPLGVAARIGGPLLLTGLVWLAGAGLGSLVMGLIGNRRSTRPGPSGTASGNTEDACAIDADGISGRIDTDTPATGHDRKKLTAGVIGIAVVVVICAYGVVAPNGGPSLKTLHVASVQGGGTRGLRKAQVNPQIVYDAQLEATAELSEPKYSFGKKYGDAPDDNLVVWPEDVVSLNGPLVGTTTQGQLAQIARSVGASLLVGVTYTVTPSTFRNEVVAFAPSGSIVGTYEKVHRVPFGEYVPYRGFFKHFANLSGVPQDAIPGTRPGYIRTPSAPVGLMVSYEVFFADSGRSATRAGAELLVVPTNTSSYSTSQVPTQEVAAARLQAIEEGRDLIQTAPTGYSAIINNDGQVLQRSVLGARQVLIANVSLRDGATIYERIGDLPILLLALLCLILGWALDLAKRRPRAQS
ncbi:MAG: apolipoprotein N-acyltransferase [Acidimicrobiales bacterium]